MLSKVKTLLSLKKWAEPVGRLLKLKGHPTSSLPVELERIIFELAARQKRSRIPVLMRVASRVRQWLEPILYEIIILEQYPYIPPTNFKVTLYGKFVRHLLLPHGTPFNLACVYLSSCPNLQSLSFFSDELAAPRPDRFRYENAFPVYPRPPSYEPPYKFPVYHHLTHLELFTQSPGDRIGWLSELPNLTYLLIFSSMSNLNDAIEPIFMRCLKLRVMLWCPWTGRWLSDIVKPTKVQIQAIDLEELEPRLVMAYLRYQQRPYHFIAHADRKWHSENAWMMADEIVDRRLETGTTDYGDIVTLPDHSLHG